MGSMPVGLSNDTNFKWHMLIWGEICCAEQKYMPFLGPSPSALSAKKSKVQEHIQMMQRCAPYFFSENALGESRVFFLFFARIHLTSQSEVLTQYWTMQNFELENVNLFIYFPNWLIWWRFNLVESSELLSGSTWIAWIWISKHKLCILAKTNLIQTNVNYFQSENADVVLRHFSVYELPRTLGRSIWAGTDDFGPRNEADRL